MLSSCPEDEPMTPGEEIPDATDETLLETSPVQSPLQVFAGMGGLALIAERLPMLYPDVIQQVRLPPHLCTEIHFFLIYSIYGANIKSIHSLTHRSLGTP